MTVATLGKRGNGLALCIPGNIATAATFADGGQPGMEAQSGAIVMRAAIPTLVGAKLAGLLGG